jgi:EmrB/QacA subfamily drug resistance transporter
VSTSEPDPTRWKALGVCLVAGFMTLLDVSIVNVALPSIKSGLHAPENALQWIVSGYALALGLLLVPSGRLGDARGRRTVFMTGVTVFVLASAACGAAPSATVLVLARVVQGFGGALITPQISGFIQTLFQGEERGKAFGFFGTVVGISTAIGPLLGGALIALFGAHSGWRAVFFVNLPVGAATLMLARRYLPAPPPRALNAPRTALDPVGVVLLGLAVICVLVPFIEQRTWHSPLRPALFPIAALLAVVWVLHERRYGRGREPVVSLDLFAIRSYVLGAGVGVLYFAGFTGTFFILTQYLQIGLHYTALQAGLSATPFAIGGALTSSLGSRQVLRRGRKLVAAGLATVVCGLLLVWVAVHAEPPAPHRGAGRRLCHLPQPDAVAVPGADEAGRERWRRPADRPEDRLLGGHRGDRQRLLHRAGDHPWRLRRRLPPRSPGDRRLRRRGPRAGARRRGDRPRALALADHRRLDAVLGELVLGGGGAEQLGDAVERVAQAGRRALPLLPQAVKLPGRRSLPFAPQHGADVALHPHQLVLNLAGARLDAAAEAMQFLRGDLDETHD